MLISLWLPVIDDEFEATVALKAGANVVQVYGFCFDAADGKPRVLLEHCPHGSLRAYLKALPRGKVGRVTSMAH